MKSKKTTALHRLAAFIVDKRSIFFLIYLFALVFCVISSGWVTVENDVTTYLTEDSETRLGIEAMNANFTMFGTARVMVSNVTAETARELQAAIAETDGVLTVSFDETESHYKDACALIEINFTHGAKDPKAIAAMETVRQLLAGYDTHIDTTVGLDENAMLDDEMTAILMVAVVLIVVVLTLTSGPTRSCRCCCSPSVPRP